MPISNLSNGLRTGVCTSTNRPTTPYEGQVIYETDTDLSYVYNGTSWQQVSGGTAVGNSGLVYVTSGTWASGAITQSFDTTFTSTYTNYRVVINMTASAGDIAFSAKMRAATVATSSNYKTLTYNAYPGIGNVAATGSNAASAFDLGNVSAVDTVVSFDLYRPQTAKITVLNGMTDNIQSAFSNTIQWFDTKGHLNDTTAYDGMQFTLGSGTFTGSYTVYGYRQ